MDVLDDERLVANRKGIGGWLVLFVIGLVFLAPLFVVIRLVTSLLEASGYSDKLGSFLVVFLLGTSLARYVANHYSFYQSLLVVSGINCVIGVSLTVFGIYAGVSLYKIKSTGLIVAKVYLGCAAAYAVLRLALLGAALDPVLLSVRRKTSLRDRVCL